MKFNYKNDKYEVIKMKLFDVLPERFFSLFSGRNREIYAEAILELYEQYKYNRIGIDYDIMRDLLQELIEVKEESGVQFELEEDIVILLLFGS
jgi:hypothetical protein